MGVDFTLTQVSGAEHRSRADPSPGPSPMVQLKVSHLAEGPVCPAGQHAPKQS